MPSSSSPPTVNDQSSSSTLVSATMDKAPDKTQRRRLLSLFGSILVALSAGSNYAFSTFGPQLQDSLHLTSTQLNIVGALGNVGVYLSGPLWGKWVDKRGPKLALLIGAIMILCSYGGMSLVYRNSWPHRSASVPALLNLLAGAGNSGAFTAAMNAQAKSFSGSQRGSATALVLAGFGLSAFMYSALSHELFPGNTSDYLLLLGVGSSVSFLTGIGLVQIIPPDPDSPSESAIDDRIAASNGRDVEGGSRHPVRPSYRRVSRSSQDLGAEAFMGASDEEDLSPMEDAEGERISEGRGLLDSERGKPADAGGEVDITGWKLLRQTDFRLLFLTTCLISGSGLLLINNVGTITRTLWDYNHSKQNTVAAVTSPTTPLLSSDLVQDQRSRLGAVFAQIPHVFGRALEDPSLSLFKHDSAGRIQQEQAHQVSAISIGNASGRVVIGFLSDVWVTYTGSAKQRVWLLLPVTLLSFSAQFLFALPETIDDVHRLLIASALGGFAYGAFHGAAPCLTFEWFGLRHAARNWSLVALAPVLSGNVFNLLFGKVFDSHVPANSPTHQCSLGEECYRTSFLITSAGTACSVLVALVLIFRRAGIPSLGGGTSG